jgi:hypothetical protein
VHDAECFNFSFQREDGVRVEERLQLPHLEQLMHWFETHDPEDTELDSSTPRDADGKKKQQREPGLLTKEEFKDTLTKVLGTHDYDDQLDNLFTRVG